MVSTRGFSLVGLLGILAALHEIFDPDKQLCSASSILQRESSHHQFCGGEQYNTCTECCCSIGEQLVKRNRTSSGCPTDPAVCGSKTNSCFCHSPYDHKTPSETKCCGNQIFDPDKQLCSASSILQRESSHHQFCGGEQYNTCTECCCFIGGRLVKQNRTSSGCPNDAAVCGSKTDSCFCHSPYDHKTSSETKCCGNQVFDPDKELCCISSILQRESSHHQCCGKEQQYNTCTECCCSIGGQLVKQNRTSSGCPKDADISNKTKECKKKK